MPSDPPAPAAPAPVVPDRLPILYRLDERPRPFPKALGLGLQHVLAMPGMAVAAILGLLLDNLIPGTDRERGLARG